MVRVTVREAHGFAGREPDAEPTRVFQPDLPRRVRRRRGPSALRSRTAPRPAPRKPWQAGRCPQGSTQSWPSLGARWETRATETFYRKLNLVAQQCEMSRYDALRKGLDALLRAEVIWSSASNRTIKSAAQSEVFCRTMGTGLAKLLGNSRPRRAARASAKGCACTMEPRAACPPSAHRQLKRMAYSSTTKPAIKGAFH